MMELIAAMDDALEDRTGQLTGMVYGKITTVDDDKGRAKARLDGMDEGDESGWLLPMWPGGFECIPAVGDSVGVSFVAGNPHRGFYTVFVDSASKNRPTEHAVLGDSMAGSVNNDKQEYNKLRQDVQNAVQTLLAGATYINAAGLATPVVWIVPPQTIQATQQLQPVKDANGSPVSPSSDSVIVLSKVIKLK